MITISKATTALALLFFAAVGCKPEELPDSDAPQKRVATDDPIETSANCQSELIGDYERMRLKARFAITKEDLRAARSLAVQFKIKYAAVSCWAETKAEGQVAAVRTKIDAESRADEIIAIIDDSLAE